MTEANGSMNTYISTLLLICGIILLITSANNIMSHAHFNISVVCEDGLRLVTTETPDISKSLFIKGCDRILEKSLKIFESTVLNSTICAGIGVLMILLPILSRKVRRFQK